MKRLAIAAIFAAGAATAADLVATQGKDTVRLTQQPCPAEVLLMVPNLGDKMKKATAVIDGKEYVACWLFFNGQVLMQYADGDTAAIPASHFQRSPGI